MDTILETGHRILCVNKTKQKPTPKNLPSTRTIKYDKANYSNKSHHSARAFRCSRAVAFISSNIDLGKLDLSSHCMDNWFLVISLMTLHCSSTKYSQQKDDGCGMSSILNNKHVPCRSHKLHIGVEQVPRGEPPRREPASFPRQREVDWSPPACKAGLQGGGLGAKPTPQAQLKHKEKIWCYVVKTDSLSITFLTIFSLQSDAMKWKKRKLNFQVMIFVTKSY